MIRNITFALFLVANISFGQISMSNTIFAKSYSKEVSLYKSKSYVIDKIIGSSSDPVQFEIDPLAATSSGELTSLVYECNSKKLEGLLFAFYGDYWNDAGVVYQGYGFKNFNKEDALSMLSKIDKIINENMDYLVFDRDNNNLYFNFQDLTFLIYQDKFMNTKLRVFWNTFDADWDYSAFVKTKKRLERKLKTK